MGREAIKTLRERNRLQNAALGAVGDWVDTGLLDVAGDEDAARFRDTDLFAPIELDVKGRVLAFEEAANWDPLGEWCRSAGRILRQARNKDGGCLLYTSRCV